MNEQGPESPLSSRLYLQVWSPGSAGLAFLSCPPRKCPGCPEPGVSLDPQLIGNSRKDPDFRLPWSPAGGRDWGCNWGKAEMPRGRSFPQT